MTATTLLNHWIRQSHVGIIEFASASNRNALSKAMLQQLRQTLVQFESDPAVRAIVLQAQEGSPAFSSGHDLKEIRFHQQHQDGKALQDLFDLCSQTMTSIVRSPKPVVAKVDGVAAAAGCQLVASCDLAYASTRSKFVTPGVSIGLFCSTPAVALGRTVAFRKHAMEMLLTGNLVSAKHAQDIGLVNRAVNVEELHDTVDAVADTIVSRSQTAVAGGKPIFAKQMEQPTLDMAYSLASKAMCENALTDDCIEGIDAFLNKRKPQW